MQPCPSQHRTKLWKLRRRLERAQQHLDVLRSTAGTTLLGRVGFPTRADLREAEEAVVRIKDELRARGRTP